jgi:hypothetical protein
MRPAAVREPRLAAMTRPQPTVATGLRVLLAVATAVTGFVHANLYVDGGYRAIHVVGPAFLLLSSGAFAVAVLLLCWEMMLRRSRGVGEAVSERGSTISERGV